MVTQRPPRRPKLPPVTPRPGRTRRRVRGERGRCSAMSAACRREAGAVGTAADHGVAVHTADQPRLHDPCLPTATKSPKGSKADGPAAAEGTTDEMSTPEAAPVAPSSASPVSGGKRKAAAKARAKAKSYIESDDGAVWRRVVPRRGAQTCRRTSRGLSLSLCACAHSPSSPCSPCALSSLSIAEGSESDFQPSGASDNESEDEFVVRAVDVK